MRSLTIHTSLHFCLILLFVFLVSSVPAFSQTQSLTEEERAAVQDEVEEQHQQEQKAFIEGDCDKVTSFYSNEATRYLNGMPVTAEESLDFCNKIPRPFTRQGEPPEIKDNFYALSEIAAHLVRTIDFPPSDDDPHSFKREVVTKVWKKLNDEWKIVHFHSSVHTISDE